MANCINAIIVYISILYIIQLLKCHCEKYRVNPLYSCHAVLRYTSHWNTCSLMALEGIFPPVERHFYFVAL